MRGDSGEGYREMLTRMAKESGIATPTVDDLVRLDSTRTSKKLSNVDALEERTRERVPLDWARTHGKARSIRMRG